MIPEKRVALDTQSYRNKKQKNTANTNRNFQGTSVVVETTRN